MTYLEQLQGALHALVKAGEEGRRRAGAMLDPMDQAVSRRQANSKPCLGLGRRLASACSARCAPSTRRTGE